MAINPNKLTVKAQEALQAAIEIDSMPVELDQIERRIRTLEIEREALRREQEAT